MIKRNTLQRTLVLETVLRLKSHPTADEVYAEITKVYPNISRATVYRNLQELCEQGSIKRREIPGSPDRFDHSVSDHYHIRCIECGKVIDVDMDPLSNLTEKIKNNNGFEVYSHSITFSGLCSECQKNHH